MKANDDYVIESEYLYNNSGNRDKIYNVVLRAKGRSYEVVIEYGGRTSVLKQLIKYSGASLTGAREVYRNVIAEKTGSRGYKISAIDRSGRSTLTIPYSGQNKTKVELEEQAKIDAANKLKHTYNPNAIPERRLDLDL